MFETSFMVPFPFVTILYRSLAFCALRMVVSTLRYRGQSLNLFGNFLKLLSSLCRLQSCAVFTGTSSRIK